MYVPDKSGARYAPAPDRVLNFWRPEQVTAIKTIMIQML